jgi:hypothetical protein
MENEIGLTLSHGGTICNCSICCPGSAVSSDRSLNQKSASYQIIRFRSRTSNGGVASSNGSSVTSSNGSSVTCSSLCGRISSLLVCCSRIGSLLIR